MNQKIRLLSWAALGSLLATIAPVCAQGTAFTYQGRLNDGGAPANGFYDFRANLFTISNGGSPWAGPTVVSAVPVSNGVFVATLDFGAVFDGTICWLQLDVRTNGSGTFTTLSPRQQLTPTPYASFANTASNLNGTLSLGQLPGGVVTNNSVGVSLIGTFVGDGAGLSNINAQTLNGLNSASFWSAVNPKNFGAVGNNVTDDTAALQAALDYAGYSNGAPKFVHIPPGRYKCTAGLVIPRANELHIVGEDSAGGDTAILDFSTAPPSANGLTFSSLHAANGGISGLVIEGLTVIGKTNGVTAHGIFLGDPGYTTNSAFGPIGRFGIIRNCNVSGFADGISLYDWETCLIDHCGIYYNTNIGIHLFRADSCVIRDCQVGWGLGNNTTTALANFGYSLGVHVYGGEWGNCLRRLWQDGGMTIWYGGNCETVTREACLFTNVCRYLELGCRNVTGYPVPCWHVMCDPIGQDNYGIQIIDSTSEGFGHRVLVEGNAQSMPLVTASPFLPGPLIETASTIGGPITGIYWQNVIGSGTSPSGLPGGGLTNVVFKPAADYTLTNVNCYVKMTGGHSVTLPSATTNGGSWVCIFNSGNGTNAILTVLSQNINGGTKWTNTAQYASTFLFSDGTQWWAK